MILLISTCADKLSEREFVEPIEEILKRNKIRFSEIHYSKIDKMHIDNARKIIICGTTLKDFDYLNTKEFPWVKKTKKSILGICAGMQIIAKCFGGELNESCFIGNFEVENLKEDKLIDAEKFNAYFLVSKAVKGVKNFKILSKIGSIPCVIKHKTREIYGILFHPEVLNEDIILNFVKN